MAHASAQQVVEARERVVEAACAWLADPYSRGEAHQRCPETRALVQAVVDLEALTVPKDD